jgi:hypothetical protein
MAKWIVGELLAKMYYNERPFMEGVARGVCAIWTITIP